MKRIQGIKITRALSKNNVSSTYDSEIKLIKSNNSNIFNSLEYNFNYRVCICVVLDGFNNTILENLIKIRSWFKTSFVVFSIYNCNEQEILQISNFRHSVVFNSNNKNIITCRNDYLRFFLENTALFDAMIVIDSLSLHTELSNESFCCFTEKEFDTWDVIFANQSYKYYDVDNLITEDTKEYHKETNPEIKNKLKKKHQVHIPSDSEPIPVKSAFGGLAIYKKTILSSDNYYRNDEHITFNLKISENTEKMFIYPSLVLETIRDIARHYA